MSILLLIFFISRFSLVFSYNISLDIAFFIYSLRMDIIVISVLLLIPIITFTLNLFLITRLLLSIELFVIGYFEVANYFFFQEFNSRINYLFVKYIKYPKEVFSMLWESYSIELIILIPTLLFLSYRFFKFSKTQINNEKFWKKILLLPLIIIILFLGTRSSIDSSTPNQSFYSYSNSTIKNDIVNNSTFSLFYSIYLHTKEKIPNFGKLDKSIFQHSNIHYQKSIHKRKKNIVLILLESFGNSYVGILGGTPTTPRFDKMSRDGLFCSNMYSSSTRSNRGFGATISSLYANPGEGYTELPNSINNFWTIAKSMKQAGYRTIFLYGGDSKFDNMKGFSLSNGFDEVIDMYNFNKNIKRYTWGVSDEELYKKAQKLLSESEEPLFLVMFSLSSHEPFEYPKNKIKLYKKAQKQSFENAIKYADYALGKFYDNLKNNKFFENGVLAMVADHNAHIYGDAVIPVKSFKIPAIFISKDLKPREIKNITHQVDIAPTLLDISGVSATIPAIGTDLMKNDTSRAIILYNYNFAYLSEDKFVLYQENQKPLIYNMNYKQIDNNETLIKEGLKYIYQTRYIYDNRLHKSSK